MNWAKLWTSMFGTTEWLGLDIGFWVSMGISFLVAILMIVVFRSTKPYNRYNEMKPQKTEDNEEDDEN